MEAKFTLLLSIEPEGFNFNFLGKNFLLYLRDGFGRILFKNGEFFQMEKIGKKLPPFPQFDISNSIQIVSSQFRLEKKLKNSLSIDQPAFSKEEGDLLSGFSGVQPKNRVIASEQGVRTPKSGELSNALLKYETLPGITFVEHILLRVANKMGFDTPSSFLIVDHQKEKSPFLRNISTGLVVERFDNIEGATYYDLMGYLKKNIYPELGDKYDLTIGELFEGVEKILPEKEVQILAEYFYFNYLAENGDLHLKNIGIMEKNGELSLTPFYDIVNTAIYNFTPSLGLKLSKTLYKERFTEKELLEVLSPYLLPSRQREIKEQFSHQLVETLSQLNFSLYPKGKEMAESLKGRYLEKR